MKTCAEGCNDSVTLPDHVTLDILTATHNADSGRMSLSISKKSKRPNISNGVRYLNVPMASSIEDAAKCAPQAVFRSEFRVLRRGSSRH
jgi:hypothetical protein